MQNGHEEGRVGDHERDRSSRTRPSHAHHLGQRQEEQGGRHEIGDEHRGAERARAAEAQAREAVAGEDGQDDGDAGGHHADDQAVPHPREELRLAEEIRVVVRDGAGLDPERDRLEVVELGIRLERRDEHEIEREEGEEHERRQVGVRRTWWTGCARRGSAAVAMVTPSGCSGAGRRPPRPGAGSMNSEMAAPWPRLPPLRPTW